ncbi:MAG: serpin family protein [Bacteroidales bacterium]
MTRTFRISRLLPILALGTLIACEKEPVRRETPTITLHKKAAEIIEADRAFGFELFREIYAASEAENLMISPLSVSYALGMTYNGAAGTTLEAFENVLHFAGLTETEVNESYKDLMDQLLNLDSKVTFSLANSIWSRDGFPVEADFIQANRDYFDAEVRSMDFADPQTVEVINQWIEDTTNGLITDMLDQIPANAVMYLVNAIYFKAKWLYEFEKSDTYEGNFYLSGDGTSRADFMRVDGDFTFTQNEDCMAVELPYGDSAFSMVVMLPSESTGLDALVGKLSPETWESWFAQSGYGPVEVHLPKFKYGWKDSLNAPLTQLGLGVAFSSLEADFTRINPIGDLFLSRVIHQSFIEVNEEGTEAAAATIVEVVNECAGCGGTTFVADRPFLYVIKENSTGAIVFLGTVGRPVYS